MCVVGQLSRLELASKASLIFAPNALRPRAQNRRSAKPTREFANPHLKSLFFSAAAVQTTVDAFVVVSAGAAAFVNAESVGARERVVDGPHAGYSAQRLTARLVSLVHDAAQAEEERRARLRGGGGGETRRPRGERLSASFAAHVRVLLDSDALYPGDAVWARALDKARDAAFDARRQQLHMRQWSHLRECMLMLDTVELARRRPFDAVVKLRDDTIALAPWLVPQSCRACCM